MKNCNGCTVIAPKGFFRLDSTQLASTRLSSTRLDSTCPGLVRLKPFPRTLPENDVNTASVDDAVFPLFYNKFSFFYILFLFFFNHFSGSSTRCCCCCCCCCSLTHLEALPWAVYMRNLLKCLLFISLKHRRMHCL